MMYKPSFLLHSMLTSVALCSAIAVVAITPAAAAPLEFTPSPDPALESAKPLKVTVPNLHQAQKKKPAMIQHYQPETQPPTFYGGTMANQTAPQPVVAPAAPAAVSMPWMVATPQSESKKSFFDRIAADITGDTSAPAATKPDTAMATHLVADVTTNSKAAAPDDTATAAPTTAVYISNTLGDDAEVKTIKPRPGRDYAARAMMIRNQYTRAKSGKAEPYEAPTTVAEASAPNSFVLAELAPAAGGDTAPAAPEPSPNMVGTVPLIALPADLPNPTMLKKGAESATKPAAAPAADPVPATPPAPPAAAATPPPQNPPVQNIVVTVPEAPAQNIAATAPVAPPPVEKPAAPKVEVSPDINKLITPEAVQHSEQPSVLPKIELAQPALEVAPPAVAAAQPSVVKAKKKGKKEKPVAVPVAKDTSEPTDGLSPESKALLGKIKAPGTKKATPPAFSIDHSHDMQDLFKAGGDTQVGVGQNDAMGVKVEMKRASVNLDYELEKAYNALNAGQSEAAIAIYKNVLANAPNNADALFGLATTYHRARQLDMARPYYSRLLAVAPNHREGFNNFLVLLADEAPKEALTELTKLEDKNPAFSPIPAQMSLIYQKLGDLDKSTKKCCARLPYRLKT